MSSSSSSSSSYGNNLPAHETALNETQKNIIEGVLAFNFDELDELNFPIEVLDAMISPSIPEEESFSHPKIRGIIEKIRDILSHPCPQNRYIGDPSAASGQDDGIIGNEVFFWENGFGSTVKHEQRGLLGLTARNDSTALPVTKEAVVSYIHALIRKKRAEYLLLEHPHTQLSFEKVLLTRALFEKGDIDKIKTYLLSLELPELETTLINWIHNRSDHKREILVPVLAGLSNKSNLFNGIYKFISQKENYDQHYRVVQALFRRPEHANIISENMLLLTNLNILSNDNYKFVLLHPELGLIDNNKLIQEVEKHRNSHKARFYKHKQTMFMEFAPLFKISDRPNVFNAPLNKQHIEHGHEDNASNKNASPKRGSL